MRIILAIIILILAGCGRHDMIISPKSDLTVMSTNVADDRPTLEELLHRSPIKGRTELDHDSNGYYLTGFTLNHIGEENIGSPVEVGDVLIIGDAVEHKWEAEGTVTEINMGSYDIKVEGPLTVTGELHPHQYYNRPGQFFFFKKEEKEESSSILYNFDISDVDFSYKYKIYTISEDVEPHRKDYDVDVGKTVFDYDEGVLKFYKKIKQDGWRDASAVKVKIEVGESMYRPVSPNSDTNSVEVGLYANHSVERTPDMCVLDDDVIIQQTDFKTSSSGAQAIQPLIYSDIKNDYTSLQKDGKVGSSTKVRCADESSKFSICGFFLKDDATGDFYYYRKKINADFQGSRSDSEFFYNQPVTNTDYYQEVSADEYLIQTDILNKDKPFDGINNTYASTTGTATYTIKVTEKFDSVTIGRLVGDEVTAVFKDNAGTVQNTITKTIDNSIDTSGNFAGYPVTMTLYNSATPDGDPVVIDEDGTIDITITGDTIEIGTIQPQLSIEVGMTLKKFTPRARDMSKYQIGVGGEVDVVKGAVLMDYEATVMFLADNLNQVTRMFQSISRVPVGIDLAHTLNKTLVGEDKREPMQLLAYIDKFDITPILTDNEERYKDYFSVKITAREIG